MPEERPNCQETDGQPFPAIDFIQCSELHSWMQELARRSQPRPLYPVGTVVPETKTFMILDVRPPDDFLASSIKLTTQSPVRCVNIDPDEITPQVTGYELEKCIGTRSTNQRLWFMRRNRNHTDMLVFMDWGTTPDILTPKHKLLALKKILAEKDPGEAPADVKILLGGYSEWLRQYAEEATNPNMTPPDDWAPAELMESVYVPHFFRSVVQTSTRPVPPTATDADAKTAIDFLHEIYDLYNCQKQETKNMTRVLEKIYTNMIETKRSPSDEIAPFIKKLDNRKEILNEKIAKAEFAFNEVANRANWPENYQTLRDKLKARVKQLKGQIERRNAEKVKVLQQIAALHQKLYSQSDVSSIQLKNLNFSRSQPDIRHEVTSPPKRINVSRAPTGKSGQKPAYPFSRTESQVHLPDLSSSSKSDSQMDIDRRNYTDSTIPSFSTSQLEKETVLSSTPVPGTVHSKRKLTPGTTGLVNAGKNMCYVNNIVQCLSNIAELKDYFLNLDEIQGELSKLLRQIFRYLWSGQQMTLNIEPLRESVGKLCPVFATAEQQDTQEFLIVLLELLHKELIAEGSEAASQQNPSSTPQRAMEKILEGQNSIISRIFYGQSRSKIKCMSCRHQSEDGDSFDVFTSLSISLRQMAESEEVTPYHLEDDIARYLEDEEIEEWRCPICPKEQKASRQMTFATLPPVLIVHLNRFMKDAHGEIQKNTVAVTYPLQLQLQTWDTSKGYIIHEYKLQSVSSHIGNVMKHGHYKSIAKNPMNNRWYIFDDTSVTETTERFVLAQKKDAYVLFYLKIQI